ncbi:MAG: BatA domain-containing protein [Planctomycetes bacterium]|nr:BatA domain-containing protein [Planctomycetota bacterium]
MTFEFLGALWLLPVALALLALLRFLRARRREVLAGSLLIWKRVAAKETAPRRRRFEVDRSLLLQAAVLVLMVLALSGPVLAVFKAPGRRLALLLDNGPAARARLSDGKLVMEAVKEEARRVLAELEPNDRVWLVASSPLPGRVGHPAGYGKGRALQLLDEIQPALSGPEPDQAWLFLLESTKGNDRATELPLAPAAALAISPRAAPSTATQNLASAKWITVGPGPVLDNSALTAFGAEPIVSDGAKPAVELLAQVRNFSTKPVQVRVAIEALDPKAKLEGVDAAERTLALAPGEAAGAVFRITQDPRPSIRIACTSIGLTDALPEDDAACAAPRPVRKARVRFHGQAPHVEDLLKESGEAEVLAEADTSDADLEVYADTMPTGELPAGASAVLYLAPPQDAGPFEVTGKLLENPAAKLGEHDPLTRGMGETPEGLGFLIPRSRELAQLGDWRPLLTDAQGRVLAARFRLRGGKRGFVFGFVPGDGLPRERKLEPPALPALLLRLAREAAGSLEPYAVISAAALESRAGKPLPLDWRPGLDEQLKAGTGVLDARASNLAGSLGAPANERFALSALLPAPRPETLELRQYLMFLALVCALLEMWLEKSYMPAQAEGSRSASAGIEAEAPSATANAR